MAMIANELSSYKNTRYGRGPIGGTLHCSTSTVSSNTPVSYTHLDVYKRQILKRVWENDEVELVFPMKIRKIYANLKVREDAGCVAFMRGPFVYLSLIYICILAF